MSSSFNSPSFAVIPREKISRDQILFVFWWFVVRVPADVFIFFFCWGFVLVNSNVATLDSLLVYFQRAFRCIDNNMWLHRSLSCIGNCFHHSQVLRMNSAVYAVLVSCLMLSLNVFFNTFRGRIVFLSLSLSLFLSIRKIYIFFFSAISTKPEQASTEKNVFIRLL